MSLVETLSLTSLALAVGGILRFVWLDSLRFAEVTAELANQPTLSPATMRRLAHQAEVERAQVSEAPSLPKAA